MDSEVKSDGNPRNRGRANQLSVAKKSGGAVVVAVKEGYRQNMVSDISSYLRPQLREFILRGFFLRKRKTVSRSSRYLVR